MDFFEATKVVFQRIEKLEPQNVSKIIDRLLLKDQPELEMIRLAFCPDHALQILIDKVKLELDLSLKPTIYAPFSLPLMKKPLLSMFTPFISASRCPPCLPSPQNCLWIPQMPMAQQLVPLACFDPAAVEYGLHSQFGPSNLDGSCYQMQNYYPMLDFRPPDAPSRLPEMGLQVCNSFRQGYCKYGGSCRFLHVFQMQNGDCMVLNPPPTDEIMSNGSLKQLEIELIELLRSTRGIPVSVSSLPILYFDRYKKVLQVEGYQMENHRQGRFSSRMLKLLARMTATTIRLTNRPHRRESIILDEDMYRYTKFRVENRHELQVYLTFPPENTFSEQDVHNYFNNFGPVQEVRIPSQVQRMFGFVTFAYPETAALVLIKTSPHYICGSQVLVKPYRLKPMLVDRENEEKVQDQTNYNAESKLIPTPGLGDNDNDLLGKRQTEERKQSVELRPSDKGSVSSD